MKKDFKSPFSRPLGGVNINASNTPNSRNQVQIIKSNEERAIENKLISAPFNMRSPQQLGPNGTPFPNSQVAATIINDTAQNIVDGRNLTRLLPDIKVARMLLVSAIQSPNDLISCSLTFCNDADDFGNVKATLLESIEESFRSIHKIDEIIPVWLDEILFEKGAKAVMVLPESSLDEIINSDLVEKDTRLRIEGYSNAIQDNGALPSLGLLGSAKEGEKKEKTSVSSIVKRARTLSVAHENASGVVTLESNNLSHEKKFYTRSGEEKKEHAYLLQDNTDILKIKKLSEKLALEEARIRLTEHFGVKFYDATTFDDLDQYAEPEDDTEAATENYGGIQVQQSRAAANEVLNFSENQAHGIIRKRDYQWTPVKAVSNKYRANMGEPTIMEVPAECIIPVYMQGRPDDHIGCFLAIEPTGGFITVTDDTDYYREMQASRESNDNVSGQMIEQVSNATFGNNQQRRTANVREDQQLLSSAVLNHTFLEALEHGAYKGIRLALGNTEGVSRLMLGRALAGDNTHFLFVPKDLLTYIAFDYNDYGVGVSLLAQNKMQGAIRAMMQFTNTQTAINNAIIHTRIDVSFDEYESDPERTIEQIYHEAIRRRIAAYPLGVSSPLDQLEYLAVAGTSINVENHPSFPGTKVEFDYFNNSIAQIDTEFTDQLKRDFLQGLGINPESIDMSMGVELAQSIVTSNLLLAKRALIYQTKFCAGLTDHMKKYAMQSPALRQELVDIIMKNKDDFKGRKYYKALAKGDGVSEEIANKLVLKFISSTFVELPRPDLNTMEMQLAALEAKDAFYDKVVEYVISPDMIADWEVGETVVNALDHFRAMFKNYLMRQYIQEENIAPELFTLLGFDDDNAKIVDLLEGNKVYKDSMGRFFAGYIKESAKNAENIETIATNAGQNDVAENNDSYDSGGYDDYGMGDGSDSFMDDFESDMDGDEAFGGSDGDFTDGVGGDESTTSE